MLNDDNTFTEEYQGTDAFSEDFIMTNKIYQSLDKLTRHTALTPLGWFIAFVLLATPIILGFSYAGYTINSQLIQIQSRTNDMEHTTNYKQLHGGNYEKTSAQKAVKERN